MVRFRNNSPGMNLSRLWLSGSRRAKLLSENVTSPGCLPMLAGQAPAIDAWQEYAMQLALEGLLKNDSRLAHEAAAVWSAGHDKFSASEPDLGKAHGGLSAAVIFDAAGGLWDGKTLAAWQRGVAALVRSFYSISSGNPHAIGNNWWAVTHSGLYCAVAALRASGADEETLKDIRLLAEIEEWAWRRLDAFLGHFGDAGAYHEGLGYQEYTCSYLVPAALLREARTGVNLGAKFPGLRRMAEMAICSAIEGPCLDDISGRRGGWGRQLSWNDAGLGWPHSAVALMAIQWADEKVRGALVKQWIRLGGFDRPEAHSLATYGAGFFYAVYYPEDITSGGELPLRICDRKQGLWFARNGYEGKDDAVLGAYARCAHPGGHTQYDAGSFRFSALGWDWVLGGGQARPEAQWQSVVTSTDPPPPEAPCGAVLWETENVFGIELRGVHQSYSERYLAFHAGPPVAVAVLDLIDDHRDDRDWTWNLTFSPELQWTPRDDGFVLKALDGAALEVKFLGTQPEAICLEASVPTTRTFANGETRSYISRPSARARFPRIKPLNIYAILTAHAPGESIAPAVPAGGLDIAWDGLAWNRPFGMAMPNGALPGPIRTQCPFPS